MLCTALWATRNLRVPHVHTHWKPSQLGCSQWLASFVNLGMLSILDCLCFVKSTYSLLVLGDLLLPLTMSYF